VLGKLADQHGIEFVYHLCAYLSLLGVLTVFLPDIGRRSDHAVASQDNYPEVSGRNLH
jgi:FSR family fosmidomycin resistance protein-like MFS transporter